MKELIDELQKYIEIDKSINDFYSLISNKDGKKLSILEIENLIGSLNVYLSIFKNLDQISVRKKNKVLNILNEVIIYFNELLMNEICKQI